MALGIGILQAIPVFFRRGHASVMKYFVLVARTGVLPLGKIRMSRPAHLLRDLKCISIILGAELRLDHGLLLRYSAVLQQDTAPPLKDRRYLALVEMISSKAAWS
jgi:hypothetical protein